MNEENHIYFFYIREMKQIESAANKERSEANIKSKYPEKSLVFHKTVLARNPHTLYVVPRPQIDRRKVKGRNAKEVNAEALRSNQSFTCSTNRTPVFALREAKPIGPYVSLFGQFTSSTDIDYRSSRRLSLPPNTEKWTKAFAREIT